MSDINGKHIMISYSWKDDPTKIKSIEKQLRSAGISFWKDTKNGLGANLFDGMANAVEECQAVCCFISPEFAESKYCKMELEYANRLNKPIIPCFLQNFQPKGWLGLLTAGLTYFDFSNDSYDADINDLIRYIKRDILKTKTTITKTINHAPDTPKIVKKHNVKKTEYNIQHKCAIGRDDSDDDQSISLNDFSTDTTSTDEYIQETLPEPLSYSINPPIKKRSCHERRRITKIAEDFSNFL